jgi:hypothetical protein
VVPFKEDGVFYSIFIDVLGVIQGQVVLTVFRKMLEQTGTLLQVSNKFVHCMSPWHRFRLENHRG